VDTAGFAGRDALTVEEFGQLRDAGRAHALLDVREPRECAFCSLTGSLQIPMNEVPRRLEELPRDVPLVVMCHHGMRSRMVAQYLRSVGFNDVLNLEGGIDAWAVRMDPAIDRY
jgi:rhodanese-related sulfurtransferase